MAPLHHNRMPLSAMSGALQYLLSLTNTAPRATDAAMIMSFLHVALGGAIGAMLRFGAGVAVLRFASPGFPVAVLGVNILGSFLMGVFVVFSVHRGLEYLNPFVMTGVLGGFTTFSAFSLEAFTLYEQGQTGQAALYVALSVICSLLALALGVWLARGIWA